MRSDRGLFPLASEQNFAANEEEQQQRNGNHSGDGGHGENHQRAHDHVGNLPGISQGAGGGNAGRSSGLIVGVHYLDQHQTGSQHAAGHAKQTNAGLKGVILEPALAQHKADKQVDQHHADGDEHQRQSVGDKDLPGSGGDGGGDHVLQSGAGDAVHQLAINALLQRGFVDHKADDHAGYQNGADQREVRHDGMDLHQQGPHYDTDDHDNADDSQLEGQGVQRRDIGHTIAHRHPVFRADVAGALSLIHVRKGHLDMGQAPLGAHVDDHHAQNHAAQDADGGEGNTDAHGVIPKTGVLDDVAHGGGVAMAGIKAPDAHVAELIRKRTAQHPEQSRDAQTNYHLALVGGTGQKGGGHTVPSHLVELQAQEHGGAHDNHQYARPLPDSAGKGNVDRRNLAQPAGAEEHADGSGNEGGGDKVTLENGDSLTKFKPDEKQNAEVCKISQYISQCHAGSHLSLEVRFFQGTE